MLLVAPVVAHWCLALTDDQQVLWGIDLLDVPRSDIPAVTNADYSACIPDLTPGNQSTLQSAPQGLGSQKTGCGLRVSTSYNVQGKPIVCTRRTRIAVSCAQRSIPSCWATVCSTILPGGTSRGDGLAHGVCAGLIGTGQPMHATQQVRSFGLIVGGMFALIRV
jgi:hypothetical protein